MDDLISRQDAIDAIARDIPFITFTEDLKRTAQRIIGTVPSADRPTEWIPCSERLPEVFYVLCCDNHGEMIIANLFACDDSDTGFSAESEDCYMYNCVAWMPLPEPYKGGEET